LRTIRALALLLAVPSLARTAPPVNIGLDGHAPGLRFDGVGAASGGGATSRLLTDYAEPQRAQILDYLFKPGFGASLQHLKVEIGADGNSTEGAEPTHMRTAADLDCGRGYEGWLMREARRRNPAIVLTGLAWNWPEWVGKPGSAASADYLVAFARCAAGQGTPVDYMGLWNETKIDPAFAVLLRARLDAAGFARVRIVADDGRINDWGIVGDMAKAPAVRGAVDAIATHYPRFESTPEARARSAEWRKPLWSAEDGPWGDDWGVGGEQAPPLAELLNRNYIDGRITSTNIWNLVTSYYDALELPNAGLMRANTPWSGHYAVMSPVWVVAHTTQFAQPGWRYIDAASGRLAGGGSEVALHDGARWSVVVETIAATGPQRLAFALSGGLARTPVHVWHSDARRWFEEVAVLRPVAGRFALTVAPGSVYTLTSTTGQHKGAAGVAPPERAFPMPWRDDFERARFGTTPAYLSDLNGAFEIAPCPGRTGSCLHQRTTVPPTPWAYWRTMREAGALSVAGDPAWRDYRVSADVRLDGPGYASLIGRISKLASDGPRSAYQFRLYDDGRWQLLAATTEGLVAQGVSAARAGAWRRLALTMRGGAIEGAIDGRQVFALTDERQATGLAGVGSGWNAAAFDNLVVEPVAPDVPVVSAPPAPRVAAPPATPRLFVPEALDRAVHLRWSAVPGATGYRARIGVKEGVWDKTVEVGRSTEQTFRTLTNGRKYFFEVVAVNAAGASPGAGQFATPVGP